MLIAYSPLTLLWVLPYDFLVSLVDSVASLLLLRWRPLVRHIYSWAWNAFHLPSTFKQRRRLRTIRSEGDEELFRFHAKGSMRLRAIGEEVSANVLSLFDDDQALARGTRKVWGSPGIWGAVLAAFAVLLAGGAILFGGVPNVGFSFPFEPPSVALQRWFQGWNEAGLGSAAAVHPSVGITGLFSFLWFGAEGAARTVLTVILSLAAIAGMGRLGGRIGLRGPGRYLAGLVLIAGPGTAALVGRGSWLALAGAALLPWAVRAAFVHPHQLGKSRLTYVGWALLTGLLLAFFSPVLAVVPLLTVGVWRLLGGDRASFLLSVVTLAGVAAGVAFVLGDPGWLTDGARSVNVAVDEIWPIAILVAAVPMVATEGRPRTLAFTGGILALASLTLGRLWALGPGVEQAVFILASFGAALIVAAVLDGFSRNVFRLVSIAGGVALLALSVASLGNGRLGLPAGDLNERLSFATTLSDDPDPGRILHASVDRTLIPGEVRSGPGFWYRVLDGAGTTNDEVWLPEAQVGEDELLETLTAVTSGAELRPGDRLAPFAIDWVVLEGPAFILDEVLTGQLDLIPVPLDPDSRVFENDQALPIAGTAEIPWQRSGISFVGEPIDGPVGIAVNYSEGWEPDGSRSDWSVEVEGTQGLATFASPGSTTPLAYGVIALLVGSVALIVLARRRS